MFIVSIIVIIVGILLYNFPNVAYRIYQCKNDEEKSNYENRLELRNKWYYKIGHIYEDIIKNIATTFSIIAGIVAILVLIVMCALWSPMINEKIVLYQDENAKIEEQIASVITDYQEYELGIIKECAPDQAVTMVSLYPELKSDTLVAKQIDIYLENNNKIKQLKEEQINQKVIGWWFNFNAW